MISKEDEELLTLLQEECAEVIQEICKIKRFGLKSKNPYIENAKTNVENLNIEIGDLLASIDIFKERSRILDSNTISKAIDNKKKKIPSWFAGGENWKKLQNIKETK